MSIFVTEIFEIGSPSFRWNRQSGEPTL